MDQFETPHSNVHGTVRGNRNYLSCLSGFVINRQNLNGTSTARRNAILIIIPPGARLTGLAGQGDIPEPNVKNCENWRRSQAQLPAWMFHRSVRDEATGFTLEASRYFRALSTVFTRCHLGRKPQKIFFERR
jgi:hypothetical protein